MNRDDLKQILSAGYNAASWQTVLTDIFGVRTVHKNPIKLPVTNDKLADAAWELGSFETADNRIVGVYQVDLTDKPRIWQNRVGLRSLLRNVYTNDVDAALVVFVQKDKWRLSLISEIRARDPETDEVVELKTDPKRYTYLLGKDETVRTPLDRLYALNDQTVPLGFLIEAFSVDKLNRDFFNDYKSVFGRVEEEVKGTIPDAKTNDKVAEEKRRIFTQRLFNRLMFIYFLEKKGWLSYEGNPNYLRTLLSKAMDGGENFFNDRLFWVFFSGLGRAESRNVHESALLRERRGTVPYLNGGLFEKDGDGFDERGAVALSNESFGKILDLFESYNFTIDESSPLDVQVAVDPEMLGKVFEELVTGRHDSGSYYTPREVVQFMCREALIQFFGDTGIDSTKIKKLVTDYTDDDLTLAEARKLLHKLESIRIVDPACGSGAYLLGILQELTTLTGLLDTRAGNEAKDVFDRKLAIIKNNIYGVDKDNFAVQIARLRIWLSLAVDFGGDEPQPLPNLDFKIECGDSLTSPDPSRANLVGQEKSIDHYRAVKAKFFDISLTHPDDKDYRDSLLLEIKRLHDELSFWVHSNDNAAAPVDTFDWAIEFAEVFKPDANGDRGFDVVLANPPYGAKVADGVRDLYFDRRNDGPQSKDTYGLFMARGIQILRKGGVMSYIVSDTWRTIKSHLPLRRRILAQCTVHHFLDLPPWIFKATVNTCIITLVKEAASEEHSVIAADLRNLPNGNWRMLEQNLRVVAAHGFDAQTIEYARYTYPQSLISAYDNLSFFIASPELYRLMSNKQFKRLGDYADVPQGISTGQNKYYIRRVSEGEGYQRVESQKILSRADLMQLTHDEKYVNGIDPNKHQGKHFIPFDKGGESESNDGWMPNYFVPTIYFIDWSESALQRLRTLTIAERKLQEQKEDEIKNGDDRKLAAALRNPDAWFKPSITFSPTGIYSPTFRIGTGTLFQNTGSGIVCDSIAIERLLGLLAATWSRYLFKGYLNHTVHTQEGDVVEFPLIDIECKKCEEVGEKVLSIIEKQKHNSQYPYHAYEQKDIDTLVYELYGLTSDGIREVEIWYCRRYPILAEAQGFTTEVREKYADHFARCERILSKPPEYWKSNPILSLIAQGEGSKIEFKETFEANNQTGESLPGVLLANLKTIAGFLNTEGGTLIVGAHDSGVIKGLDLDLRLCKKPNLDSFELKIHDLVKDRLKAPVGKVKVSFEHLEEGDVCRIDVEPSAGITFVDTKDVYVRVGNRTEKLEGPRLAEWIQSRNAQ